MAVKAMTLVGLDVHARQTHAAIVDRVSGELRVSKLRMTPIEVASFLAGLGPGVVAVYEAGPTGFGLARAARERGVDVRVVAPGSIPKGPGDRVKTDRRDAIRLVRLLAAGELRFAFVPSVADEHFRDLVRAIEDVRGDLMRARHRLGKFLLRRGERYPGPGRAWTARHLQWLRTLSFPDICSQTTYCDYLASVELLVGRRVSLLAALEQQIPDCSHAPIIARLRCFRGIDTLSAAGLCAEIGDFKFSLSRLVSVLCCAAALLAGAAAMAASQRGTSAADTLRGARGADRLSGLGGADALSGGFGNDVLFGGSGDDRLDGGSGNDRLAGGRGHDGLDGGTGDDELRGDAGDDELDGGDGDDQLAGGDGDDFIVEAGFGNDRLLDGGRGDDLLHANRGSDRMVNGGPGADIVLGGAGNDVVVGGDGDDWLEGGDGRDVLDGGPGNDVILPGAGFNTVYGGPGDDVMTTGVLVGTYDCGPGEDVVFASWLSDGTPEERRRDEQRLFPNCETVLRRLTDPGYVGERQLVGRGVNAALLKAGHRGRAKLDAIDSAYAAQPRRPTGIGTQHGDFLDAGRDRRWALGDRWIRGLGGADHLEGSSDRDLLDGGPGADALFGRGGADRLEGGAGDDVLEGGRGRDRLDGGAGDDRLNGGIDRDIVRGGDGDDVINAVGGGRDTIDCGPGRDRVYADRGDSVRGCEIRR